MNSLLLESNSPNIRSFTNFLILLTKTKTYILLQQFVTIWRSLIYDLRQYDQTETLSEVSMSSPEYSSILL